MGRGERVRIVDTLRGVAALAVLFNHLTTGLADYPTSPRLRAVGEQGRLGVHIFFVISGFVIPYALHAAGYALRDYGRFLVKRMIRIDLPCYASVAITVALGFLTGTTRFETAPRYITLPQVLLHLGYLNYLFGYEFLNGVLWSLAIEFQYYLFIALAFPLLVDGRPLVRAYPLALLAVLGLVAPDRQLLFYYGYLFILGICTFQFVAQLLSKPAYFALLAASGLGCALTIGYPEAATGLATALAIAFVRTSVTRLAFFATISYSLYVIHVPIALRVLGATRGWLPPSASLLLGALAAIAAAWGMWRLVERPSQRWAAAIRYRSRG